MTTPNGNPPADLGAGGGGGTGAGAGGTTTAATYDQAFVDALKADLDTHKGKATEAEKKLQAREQADMTEVERLKAERDEHKTRADTLDAEAKSFKVQTAFTAAARTAGALYPESLHKLAASDDLELTAGGTVKNVVATMERLRKEYPALFTPGGGADGRAGTGQPAGPGGMNAAIRRAAGR